jgi:hypothetical protein
VLAKSLANIGGGGGRKGLGSISQSWSVDHPSNDEIRIADG